MSTPSRSPFGAGAAAPPPTAPSNQDEPSRRWRILVPVGAGAAALLLVAGVAVALSGGPADDAAPLLPAPVTVPVTPAPEPTELLEVPQRQVVSARNPFVPEVVETPAAPATDPAAPTGGGGLAGAGAPTSAPPRSGQVGSSGATGTSGRGSTATGPTGSAPTSAPTVDPLGAAETCEAADDIWASYIKTMADPALTETMAGHEVGVQVGDIEALAGSTTVPALQQPLRAWSLEMGEVRALLVGKLAVRPLKPVPENRPDPVYGQPDPGALPLVDEADVLTARTSQRERCYQLIDPLVAPEEF